MQKQITKSTKAATAKPAAKATKPAAKKAPAKAAAKGRTVRKAAPKQTINFIIEDFARPKAGQLLTSFTAAWLDMTGLNAGMAVPRTALIKIAGETAIAYHVKNGNFTKTENGLALSEKGQMAFASRDVDPQLQAAFVDVFTNGHVNDVANVKNAKAIVAM